MTGAAGSGPPAAPTRAVGVSATAVLAAALVVLAARLLPNGLPLGVVLLGAVLGSLSGLTAMGLVLVYRSSRIINFAQAEIGGLAAAVAVVMVAGYRLPYLLAVPIGLAAAVATGAVIDATVVRRFFSAPRLILTVATIGLAQILGGAELGLPTLVTHLRPLTTFTTPWSLRFSIGPIVFTADHLIAVGAVCVVSAGLAWFLARSDTGVAIRAAADSSDRALLLGIPVVRLSRVTWMVAAGLSGVAAILSAPILGPNLGVVGGPVALLVPLAAAVIAGMESLPGAVTVAVGIGIFEQAVFWSYPRSSTVDVAVFAAVLAALMWRRRRVSRADTAEVGGFVPEVRPVPAELASSPTVRRARLAGISVIGAVALVLPYFVSRAHQTLAAYMAIYGIIAVSLVVLTGWSGQISLGQFAFVGVGAATTASLLVHAGADLFVALLISAAVSALAAVLVGLPAVRFPGLFLAVTTLVFAVPVSTYLLNSSYFPWLNPLSFHRPVLLGRIDLDATLSFYYLCLGALVVACLLAANFRRSRVGRAALAVRDNWRGAAADAVDPVRAKLTAFAFSGALAGLAGGLYGVGLRGIPFAGFNPEDSLVVFTMVVVGGLGSLPGALLGAAYVQGAQFYLHGAAQLLATGAGLLVLLLVVPGGLGQVLFGIRDSLLRRLAERRDLDVPTLLGRVESPPGEGDRVPAVAGSGTGAPSSLVVRGVDAAYGSVQVLFGVDLDVRAGEIVALLGTNGAGKSTLLRVLSGLLPASGGQVAFDGRDLSGLSAVERVMAGVVTVPGGRGVFPSLTVAENLRMGSWLERRRGQPGSAEAVFELFPVLRQRHGVRAAELSGGEQQMLTLAQAMLCRPKLLLIDELSLGLAPVVVAALLDVVARINAAGTTVVVVEQSVNVATALAGRAVFLEKGQVRYTGPTAELADRPDLVRSVFLGAGPSRLGGRRGAPRRAAAPVPRLEVRALERRFGGIVAVDGVSLTVNEGDVIGVIGSNGSGKTTLFDVCSGFIPPDGGEVVLDGQTVTGRPPAELAQAGLGRVFQDARLFPSLTVAETLAVSLDRHAAVRDPVACTFRVGAVVESEAAIASRVDELIDHFRLSRYRDAFIGELSTGTRRVVELACVLGHWPRVLLADEPSTGLAQAECEVLGQLLLDVRDRTGAALLVVEHDIPLISSIADELVCLHLGRVIAQGRPADVLRDPVVVASYLGENDTAIARSTARPGSRRRRVTTTPES